MLLCRREKKQDDVYTYFLDMENGERVMLVDELITGLDNEGLEEEIDNNPGRFFRLPTKFDINEYHIMEEFIWSSDEQEKAYKLEYAIHGKGCKKRCRDNQIEYIG